MWSITVKYFQAEADAVWLILKNIWDILQRQDKLQVHDFANFLDYAFFFFLGEEIQDAT